MSPRHAPKAPGHGGLLNVCGPVRAASTGRRGAGIDWSLLGFDQDQLAKLLDPGVKQGLTDPDDVPEPPDEPVTQPGDLWVLGHHLLLCGDAGNPEHVDRLLEGAAIHLVNTDPPYNVRVEPRSNNAIAAGLSSFWSPDEAWKEGGLKHHQGLDLLRGRGAARIAKNAA